MVWTCSVTDGSTLTESCRGLSTAPFLYWESSLRPAAAMIGPCPPANGPSKTLEANTITPRMVWSPVYPALVNGMEMQRPRAAFIDYLEVVLAKLGLDLRQRSDFIVSILPRLQYTDVLFRFLCREEIAAAIQITLRSTRFSCLRIFLLYMDASRLPHLHESGDGSTSTDHHTDSSDTDRSATIRDQAVNAHVATRFAATVRETDWMTVLGSPSMHGANATEYSVYDYNNCMGLH